MMHEKLDGGARVFAGIVTPMEDGIGQHLLAAHVIVIPRAPLIVGARVGNAHGDNFSHKALV